MGLATKIRAIPWNRETRGSGTHCVDLGFGAAIEHLAGLGFLTTLIADRTSNSTLLWATDAFETLGDEYARERRMRPELLMRDGFTLKSRVEKEDAARLSRTRSRGEVATPLKIVKQMSDYLDEDWGESHAKGSWKEYVDSRRLEIACGEAPFLVSRYDMQTGEAIPLLRRTGLLDRKFLMISRNVRDEGEWAQWSMRALESIYGYEFQGDNVLMARLNILLTYRDYMMASWGREPTSDEYERAVLIVSWNIWQMDGLTGTIPFHVALEPHFDTQPALFTVEPEMPSSEIPLFKSERPCCIFDWQAQEEIDYQSLDKERRL